MPSAVAKRPAVAKRDGEFLDEERHALGAIVQRPGERAPKPRPKDPGGELGGLRRAERFDHQLLQASAAAELGAHAAQRVPARHLIAAVGTKEQHRRRLEHSVQVEQQLGGRVVHPLEIIEEHHRRVPARDLLQQVADRLEQGRLIGVGCR